MAGIFDDLPALHSTVLAEAAPTLVVAPTPPAQPSPQAEIGGARRVAMATPASRAADSPQPLPRTRISAPICLGPTPSDAVIYEDPGNPTKRFYLPRYRAAQETVNGQQQFHVSLNKAASSQNWELSVSLEAYPAPEIGDQARNAAILPHDIQVLLRYSSGQQGTPIELTFQEVTSTASGWRATLTISELGRQHAVFLALTSGSGTSLVVRRVATVAVRVGQPADGRTQPNSSDGLLYSQGTHQLDLSADPNPFIFPPAMYGYVTGGVQPPPDQSSRLRPCEAGWQAQDQFRYYMYYQNTEQGRRNEFFYLPDTFKISRLQSAPHVPAMSVKYELSDDGTEVAGAILQYLLMPQTDPRRLKAAATDLRSYLDGSSAESIVLKPLTSAAALHLSMRFPGQSQPIPRPGATVDLQHGIQDEVRLSGNQFQQLYAALFSPAGKNQLFSGVVDVIPPGFSADQRQRITLVARLDDTVGAICDVSTVPDASGTLKGRLQNRIESPARIAQIAATVFRLDKSGPGVIQHVSPPLPVTLNPDDEATFVIVAPATLPTKGTLQARLDLPGLTVLLNKEAIYDAILDGDSPESYTRTIRVWTQASVFAARPSLAAIKVDFQRGGSVQLTREQLDGSVKVRMPVKSFVLQLADEGIYSYRVTVVTMDGIGLPGDPITDSTSDLPITVK